jgi:hypothetical protein
VARRGQVGASLDGKARFHYGSATIKNRLQPVAGISPAEGLLTGL